MCDRRVTHTTSPMLAASGVAILSGFIFILLERTITNMRAKSATEYIISEIWVWVQDNTVLMNFDYEVNTPKVEVNAQYFLVTLR